MYPIKQSESIKPSLTVVNKLTTCDIPVYNTCNPGTTDSDCDCHQRCFATIAIAIRLDIKTKATRNGAYSFSQCDNFN